MESHNADTCNTQYKCKYCSQAHNNLLHVNGSTPEGKLNQNHKESADQGDEQSQQHEQQLSLSSHGKFNNVLLPIIEVKLFDSKGNCIVVKALIDTGSQVSLITDDVFKKLNLPTIGKVIDIIGVSQKETATNKAVNLSIYSCSLDYKIDVTCSVISTITLGLPCAYFDKNQLQITNNIKLSNPKFNISKVTNFPNQ